MTSIDQRVVQMRFDNTDFERNANSTISVLEKLKEKLTFKESGKALDEFQAKANKMNFDTLSKSADNLGDVLSTKLIAKMALVENMVNRITDAGVGMIKSLAFGQINTGFSKYEEKLSNTQAIMNATGKSLEEVNEQLNKLMWYTDETSYSFTDMSNNIGKFTSNNIDLEVAVKSMMGIANAAGLAGAKTQEASHAMDGFSKAMAKGYMDRQNWQWIQTAHMDTAKFKEELIKSAVALGELESSPDGVTFWTKTSKPLAVSVTDFATAMKDGWMTTEVMLDTLGKFGNYSDAVYELYQNGMSTADAMDALSGKFDEVGEAGMRASQESKTFGDALNAIKDAISSGWMATFETLFGDFEEAKEVWAALYDELYDIFAAGGDARNELLSEWKEAGGRDVFLKTLADGWNEVKKVMGVVKEAFRDIFPEATWIQLLRFTFGLRDFVAQFKLSAKAAYSLKAILKVLLIPIKAVAVGLKAAVLGLALFAQAIFKVTDLLLSMMASAELTKKVFQKLFGETQGERIFNALSEIIDNVTRSLGDAITAFDEFRKELSTNDTFLGFVESLRQGLKEFGNGFVELLASGLEAIASGDWKKFFKIIKNGLSDVGKGAQKSLKFLIDFIGKFIDLSKIRLPEFKGFESFEKFFESIKEFIKEINPFKDATDETGEKGKKLAEIITSITQAVIDFTKKINPAKILLFGFGVTMLELVHNISGLVASASKVTSSFAGIGDSAKGVLNALKARLDPNTKKAKDFGDVMIKVAAAIAILAGSLVMLTKVDPDRLKDTASAIKDLFIVIGAIAAVLGVLNLFGTKMKATSDSLDSFAKIMLGLSISMLALAAAVKIMDQIEPENAIVKIGAVILALIGLGVVVGALAKGKNEKNFKIASTTILALAGAVYIMVQAMNKVDPMRAKTGIAAIVVLMGMLDLAFLAMAKTNKESRKAASSALQIAVALEIMAFVVNQLGKMAEQNPERLVIGFVVGMIELYGMIAPLLILSRIFGKYIKDATKGYKDLAVSITLLTLPIYLLGKMKEDVLEKGMAAVKSLGKFFTGMTAMLSIVNGLFAGETSGSLVQGLKDFAIACTLLTLPVYLIGVGMDEEQIKKGIDAIGVMTIFIMGLQMVASRCKVDKDSRVGILSFIGVLALFLGAMTILSFVDFNDLLKTAGVMSAALTALGIAMYGASKVEFKKSLGTLVVAGAFVGMVIEVFKKTEDIKNPYEALAKFSGIAIALVGLAVAARVMSGEDAKGKVKLDVAISKAILMAIFLGEITMFLNALEETPEPLDMIAKAGAIAIVIMATANAAEELQNSKIDWDTAVANAALMVAFVGTAALGLIAINKLATNDNILAQAVSLGLVIIALSDAIKILDETKVDADIVNKAIMMGTIVGACALAVGLLGRYGGDNWEAVLSNAVALSLVLVALSAATKIIAEGKFEDAIPKAGTMAVLVLAVSGALLMIADIKTDGLLDKVGAIILILGALVAVVEVLGHFSVDPATVLGGLASIGEVLLAVAAVFAIIYAIDSLMGNDLDSVLDRIGLIFEKIGSVFGQFVGGIVNGFAVSSTRDAEEVGAKIEAFMSHIAVALETVKAFDNDAVTLFSNMQQCMDLMLDIIVTPGIGNSDVLDEFGQNLVLFGFKAHAFLNTMSDAKDATNAVSAIKTMAEVADLLKTGPFEDMPDLTAFGEELRSFTPYMNNFLIAVSSSGIKPSTVTAATNAAKTMAEFAIGLSADGVPEAMRLYSGDGQGVLTKFGAELAAFAPEIVKYANTVSEISDWSGVEKSSTAAECVAEFAKKLPSEGGVLQDWIGEKKTLSKFGTELAIFGPHFKDYANTMAEVADWDAVTKSATAAVKVAETYNKLPSEDGVLQHWIGEKKTLSTFGDELSSFAPKFRAYSLIMKEIDTDAVEKSTDSIKKVADIYSELPTTGGWMEAILGGTMDLSTFSTHLSNLGHALDQYYADIQFIDFDKFDNSLTATSLVIDLSNELGNFNSTNVARFTNAIVDLADEGIQQFYNAFVGHRTIISDSGKLMVSYFYTGMQEKAYLMTDIGSEFVTKFTGAVGSQESKFKLEGAGLNISSVLADAVANADVFKGMAEKILSYVGDGLYSKSADLKNKIETLLGEILRTFNEFNDNNDQYSNVYRVIGEKMFIALIVAFSNRDKEITDAVKKVVKTFKTQFEKQNKELRKIGQYLMQGIAKGIAEDKSAEKAADQAVKKIVKQMRKTGDINSPSEETRKNVGHELSEGVAVGIEENKAPEEAAETKVETVLEVFESAPDAEAVVDAGTMMTMNFAEGLGSDDALEKARNSGAAAAEAFQDGIESVSIGIPTENLSMSVHNGIGPNQLEMEAHMKRMAEKYRPWETVHGLGPGGDEMAASMKRQQEMLRITQRNASFVHSVMADEMAMNESMTRATEKRAAHIIDLYNKYVYRSDGPSNGMQNQFMLDPYASGYIQKAIAKTSTYAFVAEFEKQFDSLDSIRTVTDKAIRQAKDKLKQLEGLVETQTATVETAQQNYISALRTYGETAQETADAFVDWAYEDKKLHEYKKAIEETRAEIAKYGKEDITRWGQEFISMTADSVSEIRKLVDEEGNELLDFIDALQEDIADGILNNPVVMDAITERLSDILGVFEDMIDNNDFKYEMQDKEYQLWEKTLGHDATEQEKYEKKLELLDKHMATAAKDVKIREKEYNDMVGLYGEGSRKAEEARGRLIDAQLELAELAEEQQQIEFDISKAEKDAAKEAQKAAEAVEEAAEQEEESTEKLRTAREKAEEEFEEWRTDGYLDKWHEYGATDEELMEALLAKYEDDKPKEKTTKESKKETKKEETEKEEEFKASGTTVLSTMEQYLNAVNDDEITQEYEEGMMNLLSEWKKEYEQEAKRLKEEAESKTESDSSSGTGDSSGTVSSGGKATKQWDSSEVKALVKYRNRYTGEEYEANLTREEQYKMGYMAAFGWDVINNPDWEKGMADYEKGLDLKYSNPKGTMDNLKSPFEQLMAKKAKEEWIREHGEWVPGLHPTQLIDPTALSQYDGAPSSNTLARYWVYLQDPDGKWGVYWYDEVEEMLRKGYTYIEDEKKYNWVKDGTGYASDEKSDIQNEGTSWWDSYKEEYEEKLEKDVSDSTEKAVTNGVKSGVSNAAANLSSGNTGANVDYDAIISQYEKEAEEQAQAALGVEGSLAWNVNNGADFLSSLLQMGSGKLDQYYQTGVGLVNKYTNIDTSGMPENVGEALSTVSEAVGNVKDGVVNLAGSFVELNNSAPPIAEETGILSMQAFEEGLSDELSQDIMHGGALRTSFEKSGQSLGAIFSNSAVNGIASSRDRMVSTIESIMQTALNKVDSSIEQVVSNIWEKLSSLIQDMLSKVESSGGSSRVSEVVDMDSLVDPMFLHEGSSRSSSTVEALNDAISDINNAAQAISDTIAERETESDSGSQQTSTVNNYNFTQNNTSPKALSRYDIYRDTEMIVARAKGATTA